MQTLIVDRQELYRKALKDIVLSLPKAETVMEAANTEEAVTAAASDMKIDLVLACPQIFQLENHESAGLLRKLFPKSVIVLINDAGGGDGVLQSSQGCGADMITREDGRSVICGILEKAMSGYAGEGGDHTPAERTHIRPAQVDFDLTRRQKVIVEMMTHGLSNKEIASKLGISEGTVKAHSNAIFRKLDVTSRTQAVLTYMGLWRREDVPADTRFAVVV